MPDARSTEECMEAQVLSLFWLMSDLSLFIF